MWKDYGTRITKIILKNNKVGVIGLPNFETYIAIGIKTIRSRYTDQWDRTENIATGPTNMPN